MLLIQGEEVLIYPILTLCSSCEYYKEYENKAECHYGNFSLTITEARIAVPLDYECFNYTERTKNDTI
jgi:hypothetical protein